MVLNQMVVDAVVLEHRSLRDAARTYGVSKSWVAELVRRYREGGEAALVAQSKRPRTNPRQMPLDVEDPVVALRKELGDLGTGAGADSIQSAYAARFGHPPSVSAIHRALTRRGFITAQPRKRPKSSYVRFEADLPNECWQGDMTHWQLTGGTAVEIVNFIDDHSRLLVAARACYVTKATDVRETFEEARQRYGTPASVLTDIQDVWQPTTPRTVRLAA
jgi:transposase